MFSMFAKGAAPWLLIATVLCHAAALEGTAEEACREVTCATPAKPLATDSLIQSQLKFKGVSKLVQTHVNSEDDVDFTNLFEMLDHDGDGNVHEADFVRVASELESSASPEDLHAMFTETDGDSDGSITYNEMMVEKAKMHVFLLTANETDDLAEDTEADASEPFDQDVRETLLEAKAEEGEHQDLLSRKANAALQGMHGPRSRCTHDRCCKCFLFFCNCWDNRRRRSSPRRRAPPPRRRAPSSSCSSCPPTPSSLRNVAEYRGCYESWTDSNVLHQWTTYPNNPNLRKHCIDHCQGRSFGYAAVQKAKECYCSMSMTSAKQTLANQCDHAGVVGVGGTWRKAMYRAFR